MPIGESDQQRRDVGAIGIAHDVAHQQGASIGRPAVMGQNTLRIGARGIEAVDGKRLPESVDLQGEIAVHRPVDRNPDRRHLHVGNDPRRIPQPTIEPVSLEAGCRIVQRRTERMRQHSDRSMAADRMTGGAAEAVRADQPRAMNRNLVRIARSSRFDERGRQPIDRSQVIDDRRAFVVVKIEDRHSDRQPLAPPRPLAQHGMQHVGTKAIADAVERRRANPSRLERLIASRSVDDRLREPGSPSASFMAGETAAMRRQ